MGSGAFLFVFQLLANAAALSSNEKCFAYSKGAGTGVGAVVDAGALDQLAAKA
jgi:hypothetical protein